MKLHFVKKQLLQYIINQNVFNTYNRIYQHIFRY